MLFNGEDLVLVVIVQSGGPWIVRASLIYAKASLLITWSLCITLWKGLSFLRALNSTGDSSLSAWSVSPVLLIRRLVSLEQIIAVVIGVLTSVSLEILFPERSSVPRVGESVIDRLYTLKIIGSLLLISALLRVWLTSWLTAFSLLIVVASPLSFQLVFKVGVSVLAI